MMLGGRAREVVPAPEILRPFAMTRIFALEGGGALME